MQGSLRGLRVALSVDLGGAFDVDDRGRRGRRGSAAGASAAGGASVASAYPDLAAADDTFRTLRAWHFQATFGDLLAEHPDAFKQSLADNIRRGGGAHRRRRRPRLRASARRWRRRCATSSPTYDVLVLPVSQVPPFPADQEFPTEINGRPMATYLDWMRSAYLITVTGCPAISVPAGTTAGRAAGRLQLVAPHGERPAAAGDRRGVRGGLRAP